MSKKFLKLISFCTVLSLVFSLLIGCAKKEADQTTASTTQTSSSQSSTSQPAEANASVYPLKTDVTLTWWLEPDANVTANFKNIGDTVFGQELQKRTGVKIEFLHPVAGQAQETMNLMIASRDMPDIMEYLWGSYYNGGAELAMENKIILPLNDLIKQYAPNLTKCLNEIKDLEKLAKTDSGRIYSFPTVNPLDMQIATYGPVIRGDWLEELNLPVPKTMDDWYNALKAFKEKKGATAPFSYYDPVRMRPFGRGVFSSAYGINVGWYKDDGNKIKYGPMEPGFKDFLVTMSQWYKDGLLDNNFAMNDLRSMEANILNGKTAAILCYPGSGIGKYNPLMQEKDPKARFVPTTYPVLKEGDKLKICVTTAPYATSAVISATCKNPEIAAQLLDYGYTEEGSLLCNFGIDGVSFKMDNGYPTMLDEVLKNPGKLPIEQAWAKYSRGTYGGPFIRSRAEIDQYYQLQEQRDALKLWTENSNTDYFLPELSPLTEEVSEFGKIMSDVNTALNEYSVQVIMGSQSIDGFDKFVEQIKKMNIEKAIQIQQAALDRYNSR